MLRITQNTSVAGAQSYYSTADYYTEGQELTGTWHGKGADRLNLSGTVRKEDWEALCENRNPSTGDRLMPRNPKMRRVGYDFNFHVPKSVSVLYALTQDDRILDAFRDSVDATMESMEAEMQTRVRSEGRNEDRTTGNMVYGQFVHFTARPVDGVPDPHLHAHCFVFNTTFDTQENRWKAGQLAGVKRDAPFFEAVFHSYLARSIEELGLRTERTKTGWEIAGVPTSVIGKFSRRTAQIEAEAQEKGITDPDEKGALGARTRERKAKDLTMDELREQWSGRLSADERAALHAVGDRTASQSIPEDEQATKDAIHRAMDHVFERSAVVPERTLLAEALKQSVGKSSPAEVVGRVDKHDLIRRDREGRTYVTSWDILQEEQAMLDFAREGRGTCAPLGRHLGVENEQTYTPKRDWLSDEQKAAVRHVLTSTDRVILVRGAAGTGKTTMMQEAADGIREGGHEIFTFAPSASASRGVLRQAGFQESETVARLLVDEDLQEQARGQVLWIDEAGLLGSKTTKLLFDVANKIDARVILSGDRRQHGSVERGGTLRLLEEEAGLIPAELRQIRRQSGEYKQAVAALSEGNVREGFLRLDDLKWIKEIGDRDRYHVLADAYLNSIKQPGETLVVCPTHVESDRITREIRARLKDTGSLDRVSEREFTTLRPVSLTEAERSDRFSYQPGDVLIYHQNAAGHKKGSRLVVSDSRSVPTSQAGRFTVYRPGTIRLAPGDRIRITKNWTSTDKSTRVNNGDLHSVKGLGPAGNVVLDSGAVLPSEFGHLEYGYVVTSHASQGKSVDRVIIGQSSDSFPASSREQFYVSVSRGRKQATIFTDDKKALLEAVNQVDGRLTATELVAEREHRERGHFIQEHEMQHPADLVIAQHEHDRREVDHER